MGGVDVVVGVAVVSEADMALRGAKFGGAVWLGEGDGLAAVVVVAAVAVAPAPPAPPPPAGAAAGAGAPTAR